MVKRRGSPPDWVTPETNQCRWDGTPVDYGMVIDGLVTATRRTACGRPPAGTG
jgi:hypothetical protein